MPPVCGPRMSDGVLRRCSSRTATIRQPRTRGRCCRRCCWPKAVASNTYLPPALQLARRARRQLGTGDAGLDHGLGAPERERSPGGEQYYADRLRELQEPVQGDDACEGVYGLGGRTTPTVPGGSSAQAASDRAGTCCGDSGDPLVVGGPTAGSRWAWMWQATRAPHQGTSTSTSASIRSALRAGRDADGQPDLVAAPRARDAQGRSPMCAARPGAGAAVRRPRSCAVCASAIFVARDPWPPAAADRLSGRDAADRRRCTVTAANPWRPLRRSASSAASPFGRR